MKFGRYELLGRISVGGMAEVFRGRVSGAAGFEKIVAIKRILPHLSDDKDFISMFVDEAKLSANLNHSNIGQVFEFGRIEDRYFIALEYIHGKDLRRIQSHFQSQNQIMPIPMAIRVVLEVCNALEYAHSKRDASGHLLHIVHRYGGNNETLMLAGRDEAFRLEVPQGLADRRPAHVPAVAEELFGKFHPRRKIPAHDLHADRGA